jgi:hypothetical protein
LGNANLFVKTLYVGQSTKSSQTSKQDEGSTTIPKGSTPCGGNGGLLEKG